MKYRSLKKGEIIKHGDEFYDETIEKWVPAKCIGKYAPDPTLLAHRNYRRPNEADSPGCHGCKHSKLLCSSCLRKSATYALGYVNDPIQYAINTMENVTKIIGQDKQITFAIMALRELQSETARLRAALENIAATGCTTFSGSRCCDELDFDVDSEYGANQVCGACIAYMALKG